MKTTLMMVLIAGLLFAGCSRDTKYTVDNSSSLFMKKNTAFNDFEDLASPKFAALRGKYQLDTIFHGEQDEFRRQLLLRNWIRTIIRIGDFEPSYPGNDFAENILDEAIKGQGYHCGHYMVVQNAVMNSFGFVTRCLGAGPGVKGGPDGHHGVNEIWSNKFQKWYLSDAKYNHHFEKNNIPLSALEIREEYLRNKAADVALVKGPARTPIESDGVANAKGVMIQKTRADFAQTYTWIAWESYNDRYTNWPESGKHVSILNMYEDEYFKNNTWIWDGKPHWAYNVKDHLIRVPDRNAIEWTPNTIQSNVEIEDRIAHIQLESETPNLKGYEMKKASDNEWQEVAPALDFELTGDREEFLFRAVNLAGVDGPEHRIVIAQEAQ
ncbi:MAG: hypothetical protein WA874_13555 [Chryseosolibacter sp.]